MSCSRRLRSSPLSATSSESKVDLVTTLPFTPSPVTSARKAWFLALRPKTLPAAVIPVLVGAACAFHAGTLAFGVMAICLTCSLLLQIASNFANDVFDFEKGTDTAQRVGPARAVAQGWISPRQMKHAVVFTLLAAAVSGSYLVWLGGWPLFSLGLLALICAVAYTAGPYPLGYNGLGDVCVFFFFGPVAVCGTAYLNSGRIPPQAWWASVAIGALTTAILVVNNVRDEATDRTTGKRTLAVRWGRDAGVIEYAGLLGAAYLVPMGLFASGLSGATVLMPLITAPLALARLKELRGRRGPSLNQTLAQTAQLLVAFGALLTLGIALG